MRGSFSVDLDDGRTPGIPLACFPRLLNATPAQDHDPAGATLGIRFVSTIRYVYAGVPAEVYAAFLARPSKGEYFNAAIRDRYPFVRADAARRARRSP